MGNCLLLRNIYHIDASFGINTGRVLYKSDAEGGTFGPWVATENCWAVIKYQTWNDANGCPIIDGVQVSSQDRRINNSSDSWSWPLPVKKGQTLQINNQNTGYRIYAAL